MRTESATRSFAVDGDYLRIRLPNDPGLRHDFLGVLDEISKDIAINNANTDDIERDLGVWILASVMRSNTQETAGVFIAAQHAETGLLARIAEDDPELAKAMISFAKRGIAATDD